MKNHHKTETIDTSMPFFHSLHVHRFLHFNSDYNYVAPKRSEEYHQLFFIDKGEWIIQIGNKNYLATAGDFFLIPKGVSFSTRLPSSKQTESYVLLFNYYIYEKEFLSFLKMQRDEDFITKSTNFTENHALLFDLFNLVVPREMEVVLLYKFATNLIVNYLTDRISKNLEASIFEKKEFQPVIAYMEQNMQNNISVPDMARVVYMETDYFVNKFKRAYNIPPRQFFNELRIQKAIDLILNTEMRIEEVALEIGIDDVYYFNRFLKRHGHASPKEYRDALVQREITKYIPAKKRTKTDSGE